MKGIKFIIPFCFLPLLLFSILAISIKSLRFDLLHGSERLQGFSLDEKEAMSRGTYVCEVAPSKVNEKLAINGGFVEKSWQKGFWYWTTIVDNSNTFHVALNSTGDEKYESQLVVRNNEQSGRGYMGLSYRKGHFGGSLQTLPINDTIVYSILKKDNIDFTESNILGELRIVLRKPN